MIWRLPLIEVFGMIGNTLFKIIEKTKYIPNELFVDIDYCYYYINVEQNVWVSYLNFHPICIPLNKLSNQDSHHNLLVRKAANIFWQGKDVIISLNIKLC